MCCIAFSWSLTDHELFHKKENISMFQPLVQIVARRKKLYLMKTYISSGIEIKRKCLWYLTEATLSALAQCTQPAAIRWNQNKPESHTAIVFFSLRMSFCYFVFFCVFFLTERKNMLSVTDVGNYWTFKISGDLADATELMWNFTSLATHTNIGEWALTILIQFQFFGVLIN